MLHACLYQDITQDFHLRLIYLKTVAFVHVDADITYTDHEKDQMAALDTLATYYVQLARREKNKERRKDFFAQVRVVVWLHCTVCT